MVVYAAPRWPQKAGLGGSFTRPQVQGEPGNVLKLCSSWLALVRKKENGGGDKERMKCKSGDS